MSDVNAQASRRAEVPIVPDHVPPELVIDIDELMAPTANGEPWAALKHELPRIFYTPSMGARDLDKGAWVLTRYENIRDIYQDAELYSSCDVANFQKYVGETFRMIPIAVDPPEHAKYRMFLNPWFSPKAVGELEGQIRAVINDLIDSFADKGECDVAYDFGRLYPVRIFMSLMGFPPEDLERFLSWEHAILHTRDLEQMRWGLSSAFAYLRDFIEQTRRKPGNTLTSHIVHGRIDGQPLSEDDIMGAVSLLWLGGLDTVASTTSLMMRRLALFPELQRTLREDPGLIPDAVEEFLRMQPLVNSTRLVTRDHVLLGMNIRKGDHVRCLNAAGNFDEAEFERPWEFRLDRPFNRHFTLAGGPHRCLGSHLARRELRIALAEFLRRIPPFKIKPGTDVTAHPGLIAAPHLHLLWRA